MHLARVAGTVTATAKDAQLQGKTLLVCDLIDGHKKVLSPAALVAVDTVGAGKGDIVLISVGSAARLPQETSGTPTDATIVAVVDAVTLTKS